MIILEVNSFRVCPVADVERDRFVGGEAAHLCPPHILRVSRPRVRAGVAGPAECRQEDADRLSVPFLSVTGPRLSTQQSICQRKLNTQSVTHVRRRH